MKTNFKIHFYSLFVIGIGLMIAISCSEEGMKKMSARSKFTGDFLNRERDISALFSDEFIIKNIKTGNEKEYQMSYDKGNQLNYLISTSSKDTLDRFHAYKKKGMWFLKRPENDSLYTVQVIQMIDDTVLGWNQGFLQMLYIDELAAKDSLGLNHSGAYFHWVADKKILLSIYSDVLTHLKPEYIISFPKEVILNEMPDEDDTPQDKISQGNYIKNLYPNPAIDFLTLEMNAEGKYTIELVNKNGETQYKNQWVGMEFSVNLDLVESNTYILLLKDASGNLLESKQVIVAK